jgi:hypothetical protein
VLTAIAMDEDGTIFLADSSAGDIVALTREGRQKLRFGRRGSEKGEFTMITGIWLTPDRIVVSDAQALGVQLFDRKGRFVAGWGKHDMGKENVSLPAGVVVDARGRIVLLDGIRQELKFYDDAGRFLDRLGGFSRQPGGIAFARDLSLDRQGRLCVADTGNFRVQVLGIVDPATPKGLPGAPDVAAGGTPDARGR